MKRIVAAALATSAIAVGATLGLPAAFAGGGSQSSPVSASMSTVVGCVFANGGCSSAPGTSFSVPVDTYVAVGLCATNNSGVPYPVGSEQFTTTFGTLFNGAGAGSANDPGSPVGPTATDDLSSGPRNEIHGGNIADPQHSTDCYYVLVSSSSPGTATVTAQADGVTLDTTVRVTFH
jgi:hypothetical protein